MREDLHGFSDPCDEPIYQLTLSRFSPHDSHGPGVGAALALHLKRFWAGEQQPALDPPWGRAAASPPGERPDEGRIFSRGSRTTFHDLRHFASSGLIASGCSVKAVQMFLGHASLASPQYTYGHLWRSDDETIRAAMARFLSSAESPLSHGSAHDVAKPQFRRVVTVSRPVGGVLSGSYPKEHDRG